MNGRVVAVLVKPGEQVAAGQPVMTLEAMKMEHVHTAAIAGTISAIDVAEGEQVTTGKIVVEIEAACFVTICRRPGQAKRDPGPITTDARVTKAGATACSNNDNLWLWVPAFAGTTIDLTQPAPFPH